MRQEKLNGRPPKEQHKKRSYQVNVKLMTEEYYYLKSQASKAAMPINDYVRSAILPLCQNWDELALRLQAKGVDVTFLSKNPLCNQLLRLYPKILYP